VFGLLLASLSFPLDIVSMVIGTSSSGGVGVGGNGSSNGSSSGSGSSGRISSSNHSTISKNSIHTTTMKDNSKRMITSGTQCI